MAEGSSFHLEQKRQAGEPRLGLLLMVLEVDCVDLMILCVSRRPWLTELLTYCLTSSLPQLLAEPVVHKASARRQFELLVTFK